MKNRIYLIGAILLVMALVFTGCPEPDNGGEDEPTTYTVTFNLNYAEATGAPDALTDVESGAKITAPTAPTREFYTFAGWYKETGCTNAWDFSSDTVTDNTILYAKWTQSAAQAAAALEAILDAIDGDAASVSDTTVTLTKSIEINDLTVPAGVTLATGSFTLTVATSKALTIAGDLDTTGGSLAGDGTVSTTGAGKINTDYTATGATASAVGDAITALASAKSLWETSGTTGTYEATAGNEPLTGSKGTVSSISWIANVTFAEDPTFTSSQGTNNSVPIVWTVTADGTTSLLLYVNAISDNSPDDVTEDLDFDTVELVSAGVKVSATGTGGKITITWPDV